MNQTELDDLIAAHAAWLDDAPHGRRLELTGVALRGLRLAGRLRAARLIDVDASDCHAAGADLTFSVLERVRFTRANLAGADLRDAKLTDVDFTAAVLDDARLDLRFVDPDRRVNLRFDHARMRRVSLVEAIVRSARFDYADLRGANAERARFGTCSFVGATLRGVNLTRASFDRVDLRGADLTDARLLCARLEAAAVHGVRGLPAVTAECRITTVDVSPAGDGSALRAGSWLLEQWAPRDPLDGVAVDVARDVQPGAAPDAAFATGFTVRLNDLVTVTFIPDLARDTWAPLTAPRAEDLPRDALAARRQQALMAGCVVTPDAARAGRDERLAPEGLAAAPWAEYEVTHLFAVTPEAFARYVQEIETLLGMPKETRPTWSLGTLREYGFVQLLRARVLPGAAAVDRQALGLAPAASDGRMAD